MNQDTTMMHDDGLAIVLGQRQLMAVCCMFLVVIGLVSTLAYVAGRSITVAQSRGPERAESAPIIVDPRQTSAPVVVKTVAAPMETASAPPVVVEVPSKPSVMEAQAAPAEDLDKLTEPAAGLAYYQVGSVEKPMARVFADYLTEQGFRVRLAPGVSDEVVRVLVGPLASAQEDEKTRQALEAAGFQHFLKKY